MPYAILTIRNALTSIVLTAFINSWHPFITNIVFNSYKLSLYKTIKVWQINSIKMLIAFIWDPFICIAKHNFCTYIVFVI